MAALSRKLLQAAAEGDATTAKSMAARGANLNVLSETGETAVLMATRGKHAEIAVDLIKRGADLEARSPIHGWTALLTAVAKDSMEIIQALLDCHAKVNVTGRDGESPLMLAALLGRTTIAEILLDAGAEVDVCAEDGKRSLTHACYKGYWATALCLVERGASLDAQDCGGRAPISWACFEGHEHIVRCLAERQADIEVRDRLGWSPLMLAAHGGNLETVMCLVERQADLTARGKDGETALMLAALKGHASVIRFLSAQGVEVDAVANDGMTPLQLAADAGHFEAARALAEFGAEVPEEGLAIAASPAGPEVGTAGTPEELRSLENPGGLVLTRRLAEALVLEFEALTGALDDVKADCSKTAQRWGFAPTELGYRRLLRVVEEADIDSNRLKTVLQDARALPKDPARDGLFDWDDIGGIEEKD